MTNLSKLAGKNGRVKSGELTHAGISFQRKNAVVTADDYLEVQRRLGFQDHQSTFEFLILYALDNIDDLARAKQEIG